jgi:hypothetical protein
MGLGRKGSAAIVGALAVAAIATPGAGAQQIVLPANDMNPLLGLTGVASPDNVPVQKNPEPPLEPAPRAECGPGSRPLAGEQGRVPASAISSPEARQGWTCNLEVVGHVGGAGGFRTWRYIDRNRHECAFYDTALLHPGNAISVPGLPGNGIAVLDMSDPAHPVQTALLDSLPMQMPHESLNLNTARGLLAAEMGNGATAPGLMSIYDASADCRHPVLQSTTLAARFGHESGFSPDGRTFWVNGGEGIAAIDVSDPRNPIKLWEGAEYAHGSSVSADGNRVYVADPINGNLTILDSSQVQARKPDPAIREISRLTWTSVSVPQNTAPMTIDGHPYVLEFDEFGFRFTGVPQDLGDVGAARIIDIADEAHPRVISNIRLSINQHDNHQAALGDPGALSFAQSYAAHYCAIPREVDPQIVACSFINSGLRVFDIHDPLHPREVAYYVAPPTAGVSNGLQASDFAMSQPAFAPERREVWYTDAISGFYALRLDKSAWPDPVAATTAPCTARTVAIHLAGRPALRRVRVSVNGRRVRARRTGRRAVRVTLVPRASGRTTVRVTAVTRSGRKVTTTRRYRVCKPARR